MNAVLINSIVPDFVNVVVGFADARFLLNNFARIMWPLLPAARYNYCCLCWLNRIVNCRSWSMVLKKFNSTSSFFLPTTTATTPTTATLLNGPALLLTPFTYIDLTVNWLYVTPAQHANVLAIERSRSHPIPIQCYGSKIGGDWLAQR